MVLCDFQVDRESFNIDDRKAEQLKKLCVVLAQNFAAFISTTLSKIKKIDVVVSRGIKLMCHVFNEEKLKL